MSNIDKSTCLLEDAWKYGITKCGAKATNLSLMLKYGIPIPNGIVITSSVFSSLFKNNKLCTELTEYNNQILKNTNISVDSHQQELINIFNKITLPSNLTMDINNELKDIGLLHSPLIVRSSSSSEDGEKNSFAGVFDSFGDITFDNLAKAILNCYMSVWSYKSITYHERLKISIQNIDFAVIIQKQIDAEFSGVTFTCDPSTQAHDFFVNAFPGKGEQIASGQVNPWYFSIKRDGFLFQNKHKYFHKKFSLNLNQLNLISTVSQRVFDAIGNSEIPQDIEWVINANAIWIVQSRPITSIENATISKQIKNERIFYSNANLRDILPNVQTPLNWSLFKIVVEEMVRTPFLRAFYYKARLPQRTKLINGRAYFNLTLLQWEMYDCFGVNPKEYNVALGGHQPELKINIKATILERVLRLIRGAILYANFIAEAIISRYKCNAISKICHIKMRSDLSNLTDFELSNSIDNLLSRAFKFSRHVQLANILAGGVFLAFKKHIALYGFNIHLAKESIWDAIARIVAIANEHHELKEIFKSKNTADTLSYINQLPQDSNFLKEWKNLFGSHGHRAVDELEISHPRWVEKPDYIIESIASLISDKNGLIYKKTIDRAPSEKTNKGLSLILSMKAVSFALSLREKSKSNFVRLLLPIRLYYLAIGDRFLSRQIIDEINDIFFCTYSELKDILNGNWDGIGLRALIQKRKSDYNANTETIAEDVIEYGCVSAPKTMQTYKTRSAIKGIGVSTGFISAPARVLFSPNDGGQILPGEIVVTGSASPSWVPYFMKASGFITEVGGHLSHFSVLAREYGIPAIVNVKGICSVVKTGDIITIDSNSGEIKIGRKNTP